ncbi:MAG: ADP-ribosylglycohydrolase family protein [Brevinema sp.]
MFSFSYQEELENQYVVQAKDFPVSDVFVQELFQKDHQRLMEEWHFVIPASNVPFCNVAAAISSHYAQGYDVSQADTLFKKALPYFERKQFAELKTATADIYRALREAPKLLSSLYWDYALPNSFADITKNMSFSKTVIDPQKWNSQTRSAWWGMLIGGAYGTPLEGWNGQRLRDTYGDSLKSYVCQGLTLYNDDVTFPLCYLDFLGTQQEITALNLGREWVRHLSFAMTAEKYALEALSQGYAPPVTATLTPYFGEWIGASMRTGFWGMIFAGDPKRAMHAAYEDAIISHHYNGVYAATHIAAVTALAYTYQDTRSLIVDSQSCVPKGTLIEALFTKTLRLAEETSCPIKAFTAMHEDLQYYHWVHALPNFVIVVLALYFCENNFSKALHICGQLGLDVDSTAVEVCAILGIMFPNQIEESWKKPFHENEVASFVEKYYRTSLDELLAKMNQAFLSRQ